MVVLAGLGGNQVSYPYSALTILVLVPGHSSAHTVSFGLNDIVVSIFIEINNPGFCHQRKSGLRLSKVNVFMLSPFCSFSIEILEPDVWANDVIVTIAVDISDSSWVDSTMDWLTDFVALPFFRWVGRDFVPEQATSVAHCQQVKLLVSIDVCGDVVVGFFYNCVGILYKFLFSRFACISVPGGAGDLVNPAITIHIKSSSTYFCRDFLAKQVPDPVIRAFILKPPNICAIASSNPVQVAVLVNIYQGRLSHLSADSVDKMIFKLREFCIHRWTKYRTSHNNSEQT